MVSLLTGRDLIAIEDLSRSEIEQLMMLTAHLKRQPQPQLLQQKVVACCFFEASTRTRLSFESAVYHLGGSVIGFSDSQSTSWQRKGESLQDTIAVISHYADAIVMRHPQAGAAQLAATVAPRVPLINAGDGAHQHPTQTLLDLFTIQETQGRLEDLNIALVGDLKYGRTVHSLAQALIHFNGNHLFLVSPTPLAMPPAILSQLEQKRVKYSVHQQLDEVLAQIDILYMTRIQKERLAPDEMVYCTPHTTLCAGQLKGVRPHLKVLHPLPRLEEINSDVDATPYAYYFQQVANGLYARQALLALILKLD